MRFLSRVVTLLALSLAVLAPAAASAQNATASELAGCYDLKRAVERGLAANPQLEAARAQLLGADYGRKAAMSGFGPTASVSYGYTYTGDSSVRRTTFTTSRDLWALNLNVTQPLFTGFRLLSTYQRAKLAQDQTQAQLANAELQLILGVQTAYLDLLRGRANVKSSEDSVVRLQEQLKVTQAFYDVGLRPRLDVLQAETDLAEAQQTLLSNQNAVRTAIAQLNTLLDLPIENETEYVGELSYDPYSAQMSELLDRAYRQRPDLEIARKAVEIAGKDAKITASAFYPQVSAEWNYTQLGNSPEVDGGNGITSPSTWDVGATMNWEVFASGQTYNAYRQAKQEESSLESSLLRTRLDAALEVKTNLLALVDARDRIDVARKALEAAREGYRMAVARYQAQVGTNTDVLDNQSRVTTAEANLNGALADYKTAMANLFVSVGERNYALAVN